MTGALDLDLNQVKFIKRVPPTPHSGLRSGKYDDHLRGLANGYLIVGPFNDPAEARKHLQATRNRAVVIRKAMEGGQNLPAFAHLATERLWGAVGQDGRAYVVVINMGGAPKTGQTAAHAEPEVAEEEEPLDAGDEAEYPDADEPALFE